MHTKRERVLSAVANAIPLFRAEIFQEVGPLVVNPAVPNAEIPALIAPKLSGIRDRTVEKVHMRGDVRDEVREMLDLAADVNVQEVMEIAAPRPYREEVSL